MVGMDGTPRIPCADPAQRGKHCPENCAARGLALKKDAHTDSPRTWAVRDPGPSYPEDTPDVTGLSPKEQGVVQRGCRRKNFPDEFTD